MNATPRNRTRISPAAGATVLVVEDDPSVRELVVMQLSQLGHDTLEAVHAEAALALLGNIPTLMSCLPMSGCPAGPAASNSSNKGNENGPI